MLACNQGWTWEYVDQNMDIPRLLAMNAYWAKHPPLHIMVQSYFGFKPQAASTVPSDHKNTEQGLREFAQMFSAAGGGIG